MQVSTFHTCCMSPISFTVLVRGENTVYVPHGSPKDSTRGISAITYIHVHACMHALVIARDTASSVLRSNHFHWPPITDRQHNFSIIWSPSLWISSTYISCKQQSTAITPVVQLLQIQEVHQGPHSNAHNFFFPFLSVYLDPLSLSGLQRKIEQLFRFQLIQVP